MTGYAAMARVERGRVRALGCDGSDSADPVQPQPTMTPTAAATIEPEDAVTLGEHWDRLRDQLSMMTFYLTDPEGWR